LLPEILKIFFFQNSLATKANLANIFYIGLLYGLNGMCGDVFYGVVQVQLFGSGSYIATILQKTSVDQFIYSAHSTRQCNTFWQDTVKNLSRRKVSEFFSRSSVDFHLYLFELILTF